MNKKNLNLSSRKIKIEILPRINAGFLTHIIVLSVFPILERKMDIEIKIEDWVLNWN